MHLIYVYMKHSIEEFWKLWKREREQEREREIERERKRKRERERKRELERVQEKEITIVKLIQNICIVGVLQKAFPGTLTKDI